MTGPLVRGDGLACSYRRRGGLLRRGTPVLALRGVEVAVRRGEADALICGLEGRFETRLRIIRDVIGLAPGIAQCAAMSLIVTSEGAYFLADTHVRQNPTAEEIAEVAQACAGHVTPALCEGVPPGTYQRRLIGAVGEDRHLLPGQLRAQRRLRAPGASLVH